MLTFSDVVEQPQSFTQRLPLDDDSITLRPLLAHDVAPLAAFLQGLSPQTRYFATFPTYDRVTAQEMCDAIAKYDKLRFVLKENIQSAIVGLLELSFFITAADHQRYQSYGITLDATTDCRFGPTLADDYQEKGLGSRSFPYMMDVVRRFERQRVILWGGVLVDNPRAIHFYQKHGFQRAGTFQQDEVPFLDMILTL